MPRAGRRGSGPTWNKKCDSRAQKALTPAWKSLTFPHKNIAIMYIERQNTRRPSAPPSVTAAADLLARFYLDAASVRLSGNQYLERLREGIDDHYQQLIDYSLPEDRVKRVRDQQMTLIEKHSAVFADRAKAGILVEAHGDLRPEHVCLTEPQNGPSWRSGTWTTISARGAGHGGKKRWIT